jgi:hypothetical protein
MLQHHRPVDTSAEISGRHDFAVRLSAHSSPARQASTTSPAPRFVTIAKRPLRAEDARKHAGDLPDVTSEKICDELARRANHARRRIPEHESQEPGHEPVIQCGRCMSALARIPDSNPTSREVRKVPPGRDVGAQGCGALPIDAAKCKAARRRLHCSSLTKVDQVVALASTPARGE